MKLKNYFRLVTVTLFCLTFFSIENVQAQENKIHKTQSEANKSVGQGVTFKIPDNYLPGQFAIFKGVLMLNAKRPAGIFVTYPDENESVENLKKRALPFIAKMFLHDEKAIEKLQWQTKEIPSHPGDKSEKATLNLYEDNKQILQISIYEREWNGLTFIYGYFAMKNKADKTNKDLLDDAGKGVKDFEKFWKTFPALSK